jgi:hypothetical protein
MPPANPARFRAEKRDLAKRHGDVPVIVEKGRAALLALSG